MSANKSGALTAPRAGTPVAIIIANPLNLDETPVPNTFVAYGFFDSEPDSLVGYLKRSAASDVQWPATPIAYTSTPPEGAPSGYSWYIEFQNVPSTHQDRWVGMFVEGRDGNEFGVAAIDIIVAAPE